MSEISINRVANIDKVDQISVSFSVRETHFNVCVKILFAGFSTRDPITRVVIGEDVAVDPEIQKNTSASPS